MCVCKCVCTYLRVCMCVCTYVYVYTIHWVTEASHTCVSSHFYLQLLPVVSDKKRHIPIRAPLCSYQCFNSEGHKFYGVVDYHSNSQYDDTQ